MELRLVTKKELNPSAWTQADDEGCSSSILGHVGGSSDASWESPGEHPSLDFFPVLPLTDDFPWTKYTVFIRMCSCCVVWLSLLLSALIGACVIRCRC